MRQVFNEPSAKMTVIARPGQSLGFPRDRLAQSPIYFENARAVTELLEQLPERAPQTVLCDCEKLPGCDVT